MDVFMKSFNAKIGEICPNTLVVYMWSVTPTFNDRKYTYFILQICIIKMNISLQKTFKSMLLCRSYTSNILKKQCHTSIQPITLFVYEHIHPRTHTHTHTHTHTYIYIYIYIYIYTCVLCFCVCLWEFACVCVCVCAFFCLMSYQILRVV